MLIITISLIVVFLQSNDVVEDNKSSTTLSYNTDTIVLAKTVDNYLEEYSNIEQQEKFYTYYDYRNSILTFERINAERLRNIKIEWEKLRIKREEMLRKIEEEKRIAEKKRAEEEKKKKVTMISRGTQSKPRRTLYVTATAYTSFCDTGCIGITATGANVKNTIHHDGKRIIAVDPNVIPLYSVVKIYPNDREPFIAYAMDTGGDIKGNRIDVLISVNDASVAFDFGEQGNVKVEILREGKGD